MICACVFSDNEPKIRNSNRNSGYFFWQGGLIFDESLFISLTDTYSRT